MHQNSKDAERKLKGVRLYVPQTGFPQRRNCPQGEEICGKKKEAPDLVLHRITCETYGVCSHAAITRLSHIVKTVTCCYSHRQAKGLNAGNRLERSHSYLLLHHVSAKFKELILLPRAVFATERNGETFILGLDLSTTTCYIPKQQGQRW